MPVASARSPAACALRTQSAPPRRRCAGGARPSTLAPRLSAASCALGCRLLLQHLRYAADEAFSRVLACTGSRGATVRAAAGRGDAFAAAAAGGDAAAEADGLWLVVGLGNPGKQYALTRHNVRSRAAPLAASCCDGFAPCGVQVGFMAVDALAAAEGIAVTTTQMRALVGKGSVAGKQVLLVKPQTFMNCSGEAVVPLLKFYKVPPSRLLVIYDDLDIDVAALRLRKKGSHGGHNGMRSIVTCLSGSQDFARLRIGIGRPQGQRSVSDHVLTTFDKREATEVDVAVAVAGEVVRAVLSVGIDKAMSKFNTSSAGVQPTDTAAVPRQPSKRARTQPAAQEAAMPHA